MSNSRKPYSDDLRSNHSKMRDELNRISMELPEKTTGLGSGNYDALGDPYDKTYGSVGRVFTPGGGGLKKGGMTASKRADGIAERGKTRGTIIASGYMKGKK